MGNLHQPPHPPPTAAAAPQHRRDGSLVTNKAEGNPKMVWGSHVYANYRTRPYYFRSCKRKLLTNIESLPDELVFNILLQLPAQEIYDTIRLVCWRWYCMIRTCNFIHAHLHRSTYGLLIPNFFGISPPIFVAMRQGRIEISKFNYKIRQRVWSSCNGLLLQFHYKDFYALYIVNPATKQHFPLPRSFDKTIPVSNSGMAYAATSMVYKVVHSYFWNKGTEMARVWAILTVGVEKSWRHLPTEHLPSAYRSLISCRPLTTEGYMHWTKRTRCHHVMTLDVETEIITQSAIPEGYGERLKYYLSTGSSLTMLVVCGEWSWEVWEMKPETGEWTKLPSIDLGAKKKCKLEQFFSCSLTQQPSTCSSNRLLLPVVWLNHREVLVFRGSRGTRVCAAYNIGTQEIDFFELDTDCDSNIFQAHRNSLVWLDGC